MSRIISKPILLNRHAKFPNLKLDYGENMHMKTSKFSELDFGENVYLKEPKLKLVFFLVEVKICFLKEHIVSHFELKKLKPVKLFLVGLVL